MQAVLESLQAIIEFFTLQITSVVQLVKMLPQLAVGLFDSFAFVPDFLAPFLTLSVTISLVFALIRIL